MKKVSLVKNAIPIELCNFLSIEFQMMKDNIDMLEITNAYNDPMCIGSFSWYAPLPFETLLEYMKPKVEEITQLKLYPTYSYARIYQNNAMMEKHTDRRSSEIAVSCCLEKDVDWPLMFEDTDQELSIHMDVGDICIYRGIEVPHWRNTYTGSRQIQAFLMYVDANGPYNYLKYDTRPMLAAPYASTKQIIKDEMSGIINEPQYYNN